MKLNSIRWRLTLSYAAIALLTAFSLGLILHSVLRNYYTDQETQYLQANATRIGFIASRLLEAKLPERVIQDQSKSWSFFLQARVQVLDVNGKLIADSGVPQAQKMLFIKSAQPFELPVGNSVSQPVNSDEFFQVQILRNEEITAINSGQDVIVFNPGSVGVALPVDVSMYGLLDPASEASARRSSQVVEQKMTDQTGNSLGKVLLSDGPAYGDEILNNVMNGWIVASIAALLLAALAGWLVSNRITIPLTELTKVTSQMSQGDLSVRANVRSNDEIGTLGQSFNEMASRVEEMVGTLRSFIADAAHELHTPLTALQTNLELADEAIAPGVFFPRAQVPGSTGENASAWTLYLSRAQEQGQRLEALVKSLLDLSRIESVPRNGDFTSLDLKQLVNEISEPFASRAEQSNRLFTLGWQDETLRVRGNEMQFKQVLVNLLENALKFTPENGTIALRLDHVEAEAIVTISDTGIGISPEDLPHMFERFHRGRNASEYAGNGLGLAIVKAIVESHSGRVEAHSIGIGKGSTFSVILPVNS
jgi:signal transduction histidine kinase